nr:MAG TPA: hypothetical protein [Caudoviricetes sp.]DAJ32936.1 MAG TPA: hypothetical protein [Caudoviricetes sp.]
MTQTADRVFLYPISKFQAKTYEVQSVQSSSELSTDI